MYRWHEEHLWSVRRGAMVSLRVSGSERSLHLNENIETETRSRTLPYHTPDGALLSYHKSNHLGKYLPSGSDLCRLGKRSSSGTLLASSLAGSRLRAALRRRLSKPASPNLETG